MNIAIVCNQTRTLINFWSTLLHDLHTAGHHPICFAPDHDPEADQILNALGADVRHYSLNRKGINPIQDLGSLLGLRRKLANARKVDGVKAVFVYTIKPVIYGLPAAAMAGIPTRCAMITGLGYTFEADNPVKKALRTVTALMYQTSLRFANTVLFQNQDDLQTFEQFGCLPRGARVEMTRGTGVDMTRFAVKPLPQTTAPVFLLVARLLEAKGLHEYAEAARRVKQQCPEAKFQLLGPAEPDRGGVPLSVIGEWEKEGLVDYLGETRDTRPFVEACTVAVLPSWREGLPCTVMEAMSMGRAVIATDVPGCRDLVQPEVTGLLCPVRDPQKLAEACLRFVHEPTLAARMGEAGRRMVEEELDAHKAARHIIQNLIPPAPAAE